MSMTWVDNEDSDDFVAPTVSSFPQLDGFPDDGGPERVGWVKCDEPGCPEFWGVHGNGDFDAYLRTQGWSAVPTPEGRVEHKCLAHA